MPKNKRYFSEIAQDRAEVGKLSKDLRKALNLKDDMLPFWIYRMRILGYPPTWMRHAESQTLDIVDEFSPESSCLKNSLEDGELEDKHKYNKDSLIEFPGFNAPVPSDVKDDWLILGMPPYQPSQQLNVAAKSMKFIEKPAPYKRFKFNDSDNNSSDDQEKCSTFSINDKSQFSMEKESTDSQEVSIQSENSSEIENIKEQDLSEDVHENSKTDDQSECIPNESPSSASTSKQTAKSKVITYGTPVPKMPRLPSLDKFSVGMGELLHFENLPTSTGAYKDKIKGLIDKIRSRFTNTEKP